MRKCREDAAITPVPDLRPRRDSLTAPALAWTLRDGRSEFLGAKGKEAGMDENFATSNYIELAADIVSAYVSNNAVPTGDLPSLINEVHSALQKVGNGAVETPTEAPKPAIPVKKSVTPDYIICWRTEEVQVAEATPPHPVQHDARAVPREVGPSAGLSYGGAELRQGPVGPRQEMGLGQQRRKRRAARA
jgi:hypothetical protein